MCGEHGVRCSTANGQAVRTADDAFPPDPRDADGWETRRTDPGPKAKRGSGRRDPRTPSCRAGSRSAGQRLIPAVILVRRQYQNGCSIGATPSHSLTFSLCTHAAPFLVRNHQHPLPLLLLPTPLLVRNHHHFLPLLLPLTPSLVRNHQHLLPLLLLPTHLLPLLLLPTPYPQQHNCDGATLWHRTGGATTPARGRERRRRAMAPHRRCLTKLANGRDWTTGRGSVCGYLWLSSWCIAPSPPTTGDGAAPAAPGHAIGWMRVGTPRV